MRFRWRKTQSGRGVIHSAGHNPAGQFTLTPAR